LNLSGEFNRRSDSIVEGDEDNSGAPLVDQEPNEFEGLSGDGVMHHPSENETEYAEIDGSHQNDIFEQDNCKWLTK
jgi:hypothetical protein